MKNCKQSACKRLIAVALAALMAISLVGCGFDEPKSVSEPASGTVLSGYAPKDGSQITVTVEPTASCVVMLKDTSGRTLLSFYVRSGESATVDVPAEKMYVHYAAGKTWYGEQLLFGKDTFYSQDKELTDFTQYSWEYEFDPLADGDFEYLENDNADPPAIEGDSRDYEPETEPVVTWPVLAQTEPPLGYLGDLGGEWESVHLKDGNFSLNVHALAFSQTVYNCTEMTVNMEVTMAAGTHCKDWQVWGRSGGSFVKLAKIYLDAGDGYTSQTLTFRSPVTFDAIAITPTVVGGYSWTMAMSVTDVWVAA